MCWHYGIGTTVVAIFYYICTSIIHDAQCMSYELKTNSSLSYIDIRLHVIVTSVSAFGSKWASTPSHIIHSSFILWFRISKNDSTLFTSKLNYSLSYLGSWPTFSADWFISAKRYRHSQSYYFHCQCHVGVK